MKNTAIERFNKRMPPLINKETDEYKAIIGRFPFTREVNIDESSDFNCGGICNEFEYIIGFIDVLSKTDNIEDLTSPYLDFAIKFFSGLERFEGETDVDLLNRFYALMRRGGLPSWGTRHSIKAVFSYFFDEDDVYAVDNGVLSTEDLIVNGDFDTSLGAEWTIAVTNTRTAVITNEMPFTGSNGLKISGDGNATIEQTVTIPLGGNTVMFAHEGPIEFLVINSSGQYWNGTQWVAGEYVFSYQKDIYSRYQIQTVHFNIVASENITFRFRANGTDIVYLDRVRAGKKPVSPSIQVIIVTEGQAGGFMSLTEGGADPVGGVDYSVASYFDQSFIGGEGSGLNPVALYGILQIVKMGGVFSTLTLETRRG